MMFFVRYSGSRKRKRLILRWGAPLSHQTKNISETLYGDIKFEGRKSV